MITQDQLSAYLDGEVTASEARDIEVALEADTELRARLDQLRGGDLAVKAAMDRLLERPVPDALAQAVRAAMTAREPRPLNDNAAALRPRATLARQALWPSAIAAALVGGVMLGHLTPLAGAGTADWTSQAGSGAPQAGQAMAAALGGATSGAHVILASGRTMTPIMTFTSQDGSLCRQFDVVGAEGIESGLACRADRSAWRLVALTKAGPAASDGGYRTASGPGGDAVSAMADRLIKGEPMDAAAEADALQGR